MKVQEFITALLQERTVETEVSSDIQTHTHSDMDITYCLKHIGYRSFLQPSKLWLSIQINTVILPDSPIFSQSHIHFYSDCKDSAENIIRVHTHFHTFYLPPTTTIHHISERYFKQMENK